MAERGRGGSKGKYFHNSPENVLFCFLTSLNNCGGKGNTSINSEILEKEKSVHLFTSQQPRITSCVSILWKALGKRSISGSRGCVMLRHVCIDPCKHSETGGK